MDACSGWRLEITDRAGIPMLSEALCYLTPIGSPKDFALRDLARRAILGPVLS